ncbi:kelch-like protein 10 isoform X2 [Saccostrea echinata]|uniref:kelch-like protein 10 isoform X2 n=1 Tax=Saccostrea echinata TaxID=191078 RepID=UPI002A7FDD36|nr:kelch-like protein 10 isoform X2 [Saccostrea echinata]
METDTDTMECQMKRKLSAEAFDILWELRKSGQLCDAVIKVENKEFPIHRNIMSACSPYFRTLFTTEFFQTNAKEVVITGVSADIMSLIIDYAYTRSAAVTSDNIERLLPAADQFHVLGLVNHCCDFLMSQITAENCIGILRFAKNYFCPNLEKEAYRFLMINIADVIANSNEFLQFDIEEVCHILSSDSLNVKNEKIVFDAVIRWIDYYPVTRKVYIARLLKTIRLGLLSKKYFVEKVKVHPYVKDNEFCKPLVIDTLKYLYDLGTDEPRTMGMCCNIAAPRIPHEILFVIGGWSGASPTNIVEIYDTRADHWAICDIADRGPRAYHGTVTLNQMIYVIGGFDGIEYFNSVRSFDPITKEWKEVAPMNTKRCYVSAVVLEGYIYAIGGYDGQHRQNSAERYLPAKNQWSLIYPMHEQRSDASATSLNGKVYICGGFNGQECLNSAEVYDPETNQWTELPPMRIRRSGVGVIAYQEEIYALGGFNGLARIHSAEKYCPKRNAWIAISDMLSLRSNFAIELLDDMIFAIGGFNGVTTIYSVECYDSTTDEWYDAANMNLYRSALSACVVKELPNVEDYMDKER